MSSFASSVGNWAAKTLKEIDEGTNYGIKGFCLAVIDDTPVDMDEDDNIAARENWSLEASGHDGELVVGFDSGGAISKANVINKLESFRASRDGSLIFMNNAFGVSRYDNSGKYYANVLEFGLYPWSSSRRTINGYSTQAPSGMVRKNLLEFHLNLREYFGSSIVDFSREF